MNNDYRKRDLIQHVKDQFSSAYLTLISLIEASILGFLIFDFGSKVMPISSFSLDTIVIFCEYATILLLIIIVWGEYVIGSLVLRWIPGIADPFIPFLMGLAQASAVFFVNYEVSSQWLFSLAGLCVFSWWAYRNMYEKSEENKEDNELILTVINTWKKRNYYITGILAGLLTIVGIVVFIYSSSWLSITIGSLTLITAICYVVKCHYYWQAIYRTLIA